MKRLLILCGLPLIPLFSVSFQENSILPSDEETEPSDFEEIIVKVDGDIWDSDEALVSDRPTDFIP
jgi:hypothetical protein